MFPRGYCSPLNILRGNYQKEKNVQYTLSVILIARVGTKPSRIFHFLSYIIYLIFSETLLEHFLATLSSPKYPSFTLKKKKFLLYFKECQKIIRLKSLDAKSDVPTVAKEVLDKCKLIHQSKLTEVQHLISYLKARKRSDTKAGKCK